AVRVVPAAPGDRIVATARDGIAGVGAARDVVVACQARRADACPGGAGVVDGAGIAVVAARAVGQKEVVGTRRIRSGARFDCVADTRRGAAEGAGGRERAVRHAADAPVAVRARGRDPVTAWGTGPGDGNEPGLGDHARTRLPGDAEPHVVLPAEEIRVDGI